MTSIEFTDDELYRLRMALNNAIIYYRENDMVPHVKEAEKLFNKILSANPKAYPKSFSE